MVWFKGLVGSEWIKFRATRSTYFSLLGMTVLGIGVGMLIAQSVGDRWAAMPAAQRAATDTLNLPYRGFLIAQLIVGSLGALMMSAEYATGLIRTTFAAAPQRRAVFAAKAVVVGLTALVIGELTSAATFLIAQALLKSTGQSVSITSSLGRDAVLSVGLYTAVVALIGLAFGALLRHTAGAISALFVLVFLASDVADAIPAPWGARIGKWLPGELIGQLVTRHPDPSLLSPTASLLVLLCYPVVLLTAAGWRLSRSDA
jgi:ABC-2 type transport system permease protein